MSIVIYSTPCLFAAQGAIDDARERLRAEGGLLPAPKPGVVGLSDCCAVLDDNLSRRHTVATETERPRLKGARR